MLSYNRQMYDPLDLAPIHVKLITSYLPKTAGEWCLDKFKSLTATQYLLSVPIWDNVSSLGHKPKRRELQRKWKVKAARYEYSTWTTAEAEEGRDCAHSPQLQRPRPSKYVAQFKFRQAISSVIAYFE